MAGTKSELLARSKFHWQTIRLSHSRLHDTLLVVGGAGDCSNFALSASMALPWAFFELMGAMVL